jgi:EAL domain-containing protein (putative c-di-GMP-specific phosphodiesterase class I)
LVVETEAELQLLKGMGCRQVQGFLLARPMPAHRVPEWIHHDLDSVAQLCLQPASQP